MNHPLTLEVGPTNEVTTFLRLMKVSYLSFSTDLLVFCVFFSDPGSSLSTLESSDLTLVSALDSVDDVNPEIKGYVSTKYQLKFKDRNLG